MPTTYKGVIWRLCFLCLAWSLTLFAVGMALTYAILYECVASDLEILRLYSLGMAAGGLVVSAALSLNAYLYRRQYERSLTLGSQ